MLLDSLSGDERRESEVQEIFAYFFIKEVMKKIIDESVPYSISKDPSKALDITDDDLHKFLGICILTPVCKYSNIRHYWDKTVGVDMIKKALSLNMFEKNRGNLHFNDNSKQVLNKEAGRYDKLYKLRQVLDEVGKKFLSVPMEECLSIDEQMCATRARHRLKQYMPQKPHKWGCKLSVVCGVSGFAYKFEIYTGAENELKDRLHHEPDLGARGNTVVRLCREIPRGVFHKVYFDNYYTSLPLVSYLTEQVPECKEK
ncbi:uncharacterized protein LOC126474830 [Schistocerca serialis cubense]|uniref:uncharacterized protein LOC126474830 n=1 Tax=Schistocerca serialis cubense TaxID=2023355 RepID=UPI00214F4D63|nr:uncharacterized protein LOC126474830 [Schistocerca serialis cubense]